VTAVLVIGVAGSGSRLRLPKIGCLTRTTPQCHPVTMS